MPENKAAKQLFSKNLIRREPLTSIIIREIRSQITKKGNEPIINEKEIFDFLAYHYRTRRRFSEHPIYGFFEANQEIRSWLLNRPIYRNVNKYKEISDFINNPSIHEPYIGNIVRFVQTVDFITNNWESTNLDTLEYYLDFLTLKKTKDFDSLRDIAEDMGYIIDHQRADDDVPKDQDRVINILRPDIVYDEERKEIIILGYDLEIVDSKKRIPVRAAFSSIYIDENKYFDKIKKYVNASYSMNREGEKMLNSFTTYLLDKERLHWFFGKNKGKMRMAICTSRTRGCNLTKMIFFHEQREVASLDIPDLKLGVYHDKIIKGNEFIRNHLQPLRELQLGAALTEYYSKKDSLYLEQ